MFTISFFHTFFLMIICLLVGYIFGSHSYRHDVETLIRENNSLRERLFNMNETGEGGSLFALFALAGIAFVLVLVFLF